MVRCMSGEGEEPEDDTPEEEEAPPPPALLEAAEEGSNRGRAMVEPLELRERTKLDLKIRRKEEGDKKALPRPGIEPGTFRSSV